MPVTSPITVDVLKHLRVHGLSEKAQIEKALGKLPVSTISNLLHLGHIRSDNTQQKVVRYAITARGIAKLQGTPLPKRGNKADAGQTCDGPPKLAPSYRPGSMDAFALPSRVGNNLHWPDGRITPITDH